MQYFRWLGNQVGDAGAKALADALQRNNTLTTLYLGGEWIVFDSEELLSAWYAFAIYCSSYLTNLKCNISAD